MSVRSRKGKQCAQQQHYNNYTAGVDSEEDTRTDALFMEDGSEPGGLDDVLQVLEARYAEWMVSRVGLISSDKEKKKQNPSSSCLPKLRVARRPSVDNLLSLVAGKEPAATSDAKKASMGERGSFEGNASARTDFNLDGAKPKTKKDKNKMKNTMDLLNLCFEKNKSKKISAVDVEEEFKMRLAETQAELMAVRMGETQAALQAMDSAGTADGAVPMPALGESPQEFFAALSLESPQEFFAALSLEDQGTGEADYGGEQGLGEADELALELFQYPDGMTPASALPTAAGPAPYTHELQVYGYAYAQQHAPMSTSPYVDVYSNYTYPGYGHDTMHS